MRTTVCHLFAGVSAIIVTLVATPGLGQIPFCQDVPCQHLPSQAALKQALSQVRAEDNGGLDLDMWGTLLDRDGVVCAVVYTGEDRGDQWPGSRVISAQKANTANAFSLPKLALSTANLYAAVQPGGSLFGLQHSNPVDPDVAYEGPAERYGTKRDPLVGKRIGGVNVFGGGLPLYDEQGRLLGAIGVSGDSSCADHNIAWKTRDYLGLDWVPEGVSPTQDDNIIFDFKDGKSASGFGHPECGGTERAIAEALPKTHPIGPGKPEPQ
jgi:uncharacterized protein GlcG (DUF336 family)